MSGFYRCEYCACRVPQNSRESHELGKKHKAQVSSGHKKLYSMSDREATLLSVNSLSRIQTQDIIVNSLSDFIWLSHFNGCIKANVTTRTPSETLVQLQELFVLFPLHLFHLDSLRIDGRDDFKVVVSLIYKVVITEEPWTNFEFTIKVRMHMLQMIEQYLTLTEKIKTLALSLSSNHFAVVIYNFFKLALITQSPQSTIAYMEKELLRWFDYEEMFKIEDDPDKLQDHIIENYESIITESIDMYVEAKSSFQRHISGFD